MLHKVEKMINSWINKHYPWFDIKDLVFTIQSGDVFIYEEEYDFLVGSIPIEAVIALRSLNKAFCGINTCVGRPAIHLNGERLGN